MVEEAIRIGCERIDLEPATDGGRRITLRSLDHLSWEVLFVVRPDGRVWQSKAGRDDACVSSWLGGRPPTDGALRAAVVTAALYLKITPKEELC